MAGRPEASEGGAAAGSGGRARGGARHGRGTIQGLIPPRAGRPGPGGRLRLPPHRSPHVDVGRIYAAGGEDHAPRGRGGGRHAVDDRRVAREGTPGPPRVGVVDPDRAVFAARGDRAVPVEEGAPHIV